LRKKKSTKMADDSPVSFEGKVCVVTGAGSGIGRALAIALCQEGAKHVICVDVDEGKAMDTVRKLLGNAPAMLGGDAICASHRVCDVSDLSSMESTIEEIWQGHGRIDCFFANAGIVSKEDGNPENVNLAEFDRIFDVNFKSQLYAARILLPRWRADAKERGLPPGVLVLTASIAGLVAMPLSLAYTISKRASVGLAEFIAGQYSRKVVRVTAACPGIVETPLLTGGFLSPILKSFGAPAAPDDVADSILEAVEAGKLIAHTHRELEQVEESKVQNREAFFKRQREALRRALQTKPSAKL
jgi:NAD(P)-dependent dehydrogenase (short-subunit alcohol dehydrogenase family)